MDKKTQNLSVTLSHFSPLGIVFTSQKGAYWYDVAAAVLGSFFVPFSVARISYSNNGYSTIYAVTLAAGLLLLMLPLVVRSRSTEISFLSTTRQIIGIPGKKLPLQFCDAERFQLSVKTEKCSLILCLKKGESVTLFDDYPLNLALRVAVRIAQMVQVPITNDKGRPVKQKVDADWTLPYRLPSGRFPLEYLLLSASFAGAISILTSYRLGNIFLLDVAPKWLFLPVLAFPGSQLLKNIHQNRGYFDAVKILAVCFVIFTGFIIWSVVEPAITYVALIPGLIIMILLINTYVERKKTGLWLVPGFCASILCVGFALFASYTFHSFFLLDASVVDHIRLSAMTGSDVTIEYPNDVKTFLDAVQTSALHRSDIEPRSGNLHAHLVRPAGRDYFLDLYREGTGNRAIVVGRLSCAWFKGTLFLATLSSGSADRVLMSAGGLHVYWPPGYMK
jgi:hypothetical protein